MYSLEAVYQTAQIREFERLAQEHYHLSGQILMERAGQATFDFVKKHFPQARRIAVFCGSGNNGGDGYVFARLAHQQGLKVQIWQVGQHDSLKEEAQLVFNTCKQSNCAMLPFQFQSDLSDPELVIDAICGIGLTQALRDESVVAIKAIQALGVPILAIDIPSGVHADTGEILGAAIQATATITFIGLKLGLLTGEGVSCVGDLVVDELQLPQEIYQQVQPTAKKIQCDHYEHYLKPRAKSWHKGMSGHVLIVGGDEGFSGAVRMAAEAALRVGSGLVSIATHPAHAANLNVDCPEIMSHAVNDLATLNSLMIKASVVVLGPGLGQSAWSKMLWLATIETKLPLLVDADGLNLLSQSPRSNHHWVLTPHPGEAARLLQCSIAEIQHDRLQACRILNKKYGGACVLKGAGTIVVEAHVLPALCDKGNPGMASAGMGDILSGVIGGLMAQRIPAGDAARLGVYLHAVAGDLAAKEGGERGLMASDLLFFLRRLVND